MNLDVGELIKERELGLHCSLFATFMAGFNEFGILNQAVMNSASRRAGDFIAEYLKWVRPDSIPTTFAGLLERLNRELSISKGFVVDERGRRFSIRILTDRCRYCPVGVGGAELEGTICPFPGLFESFINGVFGGNRVKLIPVNRRFLNKEGGFCNIVYEVK